MRSSCWSCCSRSIPGLARRSIAELFPTKVRYTALSVGYNIPRGDLRAVRAVIATWLIQSTGSILAPAYYVVAASAVTLVTMIWVKETAFSPLE